jgi:acetyl-CoA synthetase
MSHQQLYPVTDAALARTYLSNEQYLQMYQQSINEPELFWAEHGRRLDWITPYTKVKDSSFELGNVHVNWFSDGTLNASYNCLDRHLPAKASQVAYFWEGDEPGVQQSVTYQ